MFYVGQKVVCVDDKPSPKKTFGYYKNLITPRVGQIYTIRGFRSAYSVWLCEIRNEPRTYSDGFVEASFLAARFRPVTDISTLQSIVAEVKTGKPRKIEADRFDRQKVQP